MKVIKLIVLILLTLVFIAYGVGFMVYRGVNTTLINQQYYRSMTDEYEIAKIAHTEIASMIPDVVRDGLTGGTPVTDAAKKAVLDMQVDLISSAIIDALDEQWIGEQVVMVTDDMVTLLKGESTQLTAVVDLSGKLGEIEKNIAAGLETFSDAEIYAMFGAPRAYIPAIAQQIVGQLGLPSSLVLSDLVDDMAPGTFEMVGRYLAIMNTTFNFLAVVVILVFLLLCIVFYKFAGGLQWFGVSAIITSVIFFIVTGYFANITRIVGLTGVDLATLPVSASVLQDIISFTFSKMNLMPIIFIVVGVILFVLGLLLNKKRKPA